jgi:hypothetical protein
LTPTPTPSIEPSSGLDKLYLVFPTGIEKEQWWLAFNKISVGDKWPHAPESLSTLMHALGPVLTLPSKTNTIRPTKHSGVLDVTADLRWISFLMARYWTSIYQTDFVRVWIQDKISTKLSAINRPDFLVPLHLQFNDIRGS